MFLEGVYMGHEVWALLSIFIKLFIYAPYVLGVLKGKFVPHSFSWMVFFSLDFIGFLVQFYNGAGMGAFPTLAGALLCFLIMALGFYKGNQDIRRCDFIALVSAFSLLPLWYLANSSLLVLLIVMIIGIVGSFPTWRKVTDKPNEESSLLFFLIGASALVSMFSIDQVMLTTVLYPLFTVISSCALATYIIVRSKTLKVFD